MEEVSQEEVRMWLRKMYKCAWTYDHNVITIMCDEEEFNIRPDKLEGKEKMMLERILHTLLLHPFS